MKGAISFHRWIRDQVAANVPLDQFVRAIVTAKGPNFTNPPASFYRRIRNPEDAVETVSQVFLGVRMGCAKCHNHVAERWTQDDYYGMAAFFSQVRYKNGPQNYAQYNKEETVYLVPDAEVRQPRTGVVMKPKPLGGEPVEVSGDEDRREKLADWLVSPSNPFFARAAVNRIWYHLMGRGIVEPVDDFRESNPPASAELLKALADDFVAHGFDVKRTIRLILNSRVYQLSSLPNEFNAEDTRYFSHATVRMLSAEQLLDSASLAAGVPEKLFNLPAGDAGGAGARRRARAPVPERLRPAGASRACECERGTDSTLEQALQIVGGRTLHNKVIAQDNRIGKLLKVGRGRRHARGSALPGHALALSRPRRSASWPCPSSPARPTTAAGRRGPALDPAESPRVLVPALRLFEEPRRPECRPNRIGLQGPRADLASEENRHDLVNAWFFTWEDGTRHHRVLDTGSRIRGSCR